MKRRLTAVEWESLCEHADGRRAAGMPWHEIEDAAAAAGVCEEDIAEMQSRHRRWARKERKRAESGGLELIEEETSIAPAGDALTVSKIHEAIRRATLYVCGEGVVKAKPVWRNTVNRTLRPEDRVEIFKGPGPSWLVCAVCIHHADGTREILPEHRVRQKLPAGYARTRGVTLRMQVLDFEEGLDTRGIVQRVAAVAFCYFGERSGIRNASQLAELSGVSRQRAHTVQVQLREEHEELAGNSVGLAGQVPARRPKRAGKKPDQRRK